MSKYLKKDAETLRRQKAELDAAIELAQKQRSDILGPIFLRIIDSIDDAKRAKAYINIIESNATKDEKKALKSMLKHLKSLVDAEKSSQQIFPENDYSSLSSGTNVSTKLNEPLTDHLNNSE